MSALLLALLTPLFAEMQICEPGTGCSQCHETVRLAFTAEPERQRVRVSGSFSEDGEPDEVLEDCRIDDPANWTCADTVTWVVAHRGVVRISQPERQDPPFEICMR